MEEQLLTHKIRVSHIGLINKIDKRENKTV